MAGRRAQTPRVVTRAQVVHVPDVATDRAVTAVRDSVHRLEQERKHDVFEFDLVVGTNKIPHALGRAVTGYTITPTVAPYGHLLGRRILTGAGTNTPTTGTEIVVMRAIGGGGGGGGATPGAGAGAAAGGSSGVLLEIVLGAAGTALTSGAYSAGAAGAGGSQVGPAAGGTGGDTTIVLGGVTYTAKGGGGGTAMAGTAGNNMVLPGVPAPGTSSGGISSYGGGGIGIVVGGGAWVAGAGGSTALGAGGAGIGGTNAGNAGSGYGAGGGGAAAQSAARAGGAATAGAILLDEYGASFSHCINRDNPRPDLWLWIDVRGTPQPKATIFVY